MSTVHRCAALAAGSVLVAASGLLLVATAPPQDRPDALPIAFFSDRDGNMEIYGMKADGTRQTRLTTEPAEDRDPVWSPDGAWIAFISRRQGGETDIFKMRPDGREQTRLTKTSGSDFGQVWSPDGRRIAFVSESQFNSDIFLMNADGTGVRNLTNNPAEDVSPSWSSDGRTIVFLSNRDDKSRKDDAGEVYVVDAASGEQRAVTRKQLAVQPSWLPVRDQILFFSADRKRGVLIQQVAPTGGEPLVLGGSGTDHLPLASPKGRYIAFQSSRHGGATAAVYAMRSDGTEPRRVSPGPEPVLGPSGWSPDEQVVLYAAFQNNNWEIHAATVDGKTDRRLTQNTFADMAAVWSPAGR